MVSRRTIIAALSVPVSGSLAGCRGLPAAGGKDSPTDLETTLTEREGTALESYEAGYELHTDATDELDGFVTSNEVADRTMSSKISIRSAAHLLTRLKRSKRLVTSSNRLVQPPQ